MWSKLYNGDCLEVMDKLIAEEVETDNADSSIQESMLSKAGNGSNLATMVDVQVGLYVDSTKVANINKLENEVTLSFEIPAFFNSYNLKNCSFPSIFNPPL